MSLAPPTAPVTTPLTTRIEEMVKDIPGWSPLDQLYTLNALGLATAHLVGDFLEIGSWCGRSGTVLGHAARAIGGGTLVHCIDLFPRLSDWKRHPDGSYFFEVVIAGRTHRAHLSQTVWASAFESQTSRIYQDYDSPLACFEQQIARFALRDTIRIHHGDSSSFATAQPTDFRCKLAFINGDHGYEAVCADIRMVQQHLVPGGWICFDDAFSCYDGVDAAIRELILADPRFDLAQQMTRKLFVARRRPAQDSSA